MLISKFIEAIKPHVDFNSIKTICDIGSRDLEQSFELLKVFPNATIHAFEPNPESYEKCLDQAVEGIEVYPYAVLDYDGMTSFYAVDQKDNSGASSIFEPTEDVVGVDRFEGMKKIDVMCTRIDTWAEQNKIEKIDLVWMDVQSAEIPALKGFGTMLDDIQAIATEAATGTLYFGNRQYEPSHYQEVNKFMTDKGFVEVSYDQPWPLEADLVYINKNEKR
ncbi:MAG: FkbM family methyltransferase [Blastocatellia bacterium]|nr:FkbM family methyltransferase [Blastocatellia bacterium]